MGESSVKSSSLVIELEIQTQGPQWRAGAREEQIQESRFGARSSLRAGGDGAEVERVGCG